VKNLFKLTLFCINFALFSASAQEEITPLEKMYNDGILTSEELNNFNARVYDFLKEAEEGYDVCTGRFTQKTIDEFQCLTQELNDIKLQRAHLLG